MGIPPRKIYVSDMSAADGPGVTAGGLGARPAAEGRQQRLASFGRERLFGQTPEYANRLAKLFQVGPAGLALREMRLEPRPVDRREPVLEIVGHELHQLPARQFRQVRHDHVASVAAKYRSSALRTRERARCSSTR